MANIDPELQEQFDEVERELLERWPETKMDPTLARVRALTELLGDPQKAYPVIHITGTNGKTSTARMIEALLRELNLRTGRFTSPHLESMNERVSLDGAPIPIRRFEGAPMVAETRAYFRELPTFSSGLI